MPISSADSIQASVVHRRSLSVFTKPARPGRVKTRLIGDLSASQTAQLHSAFVDDVVERLAVGGFSLRLAWALEREEAVPEYRLASGEEVLGIRQQGETLGDRLFNGLRAAAEAYPAVAAMGSDHPTVPLQVVEEGFERIEQGADVVVGPASDGGYYLIACSRQALNGELFAGIPWSTAGVLEATLEAAERLALKCETLPEGSDVDTPDDLDRLVTLLKERRLLMTSEAASPAATLACPRTEGVLRAWGRLPQLGQS